MPQGRGGRGSIYVWASGDGGHNDDCNCDGYAASMWTISINSATNDGQTASYDESCSSTLASTFSNGKSGYQDAGVVSLNTPLCLCFYREMLCIARTMPSQNACLPVRHTPVFCRTPLNKSSNFFSPPGSHTILVFFRTKRYGNIPTGTPITGALNAGGVINIAIFNQYLAFSRK